MIYLKCDITVSTAGGARAATARSGRRAARAVAAQAGGRRPAGWLQRWLKAAPNPPLGVVFVAAVGGGGGAGWCGLRRRGGGGWRGEERAGGGL